ncbi:hypothetical protein ACFST9_12560 [Hymenobacter monticola]|uniref:Uncharacterized protein n=1 Tax=Hymenobacter monticola TaxID=1705399 RepID=A0ABY4BBD0_9BACT|nr:hypothetical protein [Hymenobacter monticola]UOE34981.1 hypothetical protein MTP16_04850 [Hymenobacter monticola]
MLLLSVAFAPPTKTVAEVRYQLVLRNILHPRIRGKVSEQRVYSFVGRFNPAVYPDTLTMYHDGAPAKPSSGADPTGKYIVRKMDRAYHGSFGNLATFDGSATAASRRWCNACAPSCATTTPSR